MTVLSLSIYSSLIAYFCCQENCRHLLLSAIGKHRIAEIQETVFAKTPSPVLAKRPNECLDL